MEHGWVVVRNWDKFQRYDRNPEWIRLWTELDANDDWLQASLAERGMLTTIWIEFARSRGVLSTRTVMQVCGKSARTAHLEALSHAGFIEIVPDRPRAHTRATHAAEKRREEKKDLGGPVHDGPVEKNDSSSLGLLSFPEIGRSSDV